MKFISKVCIIILILLIMVGITYANKDRAGSRDYPLISRMPSFWIASYKDIEHDLHTFYDSAGNKINIEGHKYFIDYRLNKGVQPPGRLLIIKNHENAFKKIGGKILKRKKGHIYCKVVKDGKEIWIHLKSGVDRNYRLTIVEREQMEQKVTADLDTSSAGAASAPKSTREAAKTKSLENGKLDESAKPDEPDVVMREEKDIQGNLLKQYTEIKDANGNYIKHGKYIERASNGNKTLEGKYVNGQKHGLWIGYWGEKENDKYYEVLYVNGLKQGIFYGYHPSGKLASKWNYKDNKLNGERVNWHPNGRKSSEGNYIEDKPDGLHIYWDKDGNVLRKEVF